MRNFNKYKKGYFMPPVKSLKWTEKDAIDKAPVWCSVDRSEEHTSELQSRI